MQFKHGFHQVVPVKTALIYSFLFDVCSFDRLFPLIDLCFYFVNLSATRVLRFSNRIAIFPKPSTVIFNRGHAFRVPGNIVEEASSLISLPWQMFKLLSLPCCVFTICYLIFMRFYIRHCWKSPRGAEVVPSTSFL